MSLHFFAFKIFQFCIIISGISNSFTDKFARKKIAMSLELPTKNLSSSLIKRLVGGENVIVGRKPYSNSIINFCMTSKMYISCNNVPKFDLLDQAIKNRVRIIPFETIFKNIPKHKNEKKLKVSLHQDRI
ncbi:hypothetical protein HZS_5596 [Henneguya salminicola]|nr:hypothetical protein HZS_5596 [Henneguya salminicola]